MNSKSQSQKIKYGISFEWAVLVFEDPMLLTLPDEHSDNDRWRTTG